MVTVAALVALPELITESRLSSSTSNTLPCYATCPLNSYLPQCPLASSPGAHEDLMLTAVLLDIAALDEEANKLWPRHITATRHACGHRAKR